MTEQPPSYPPPPPGGFPPPGPDYPAQGGPGYPQPSAGTNTFAIASLVLSLLGWLCVGIGSILGVVFGFLALNQIKQSGQGGRGLAIAGIVIGLISIVGGIIYWIIVMVTASSDTQVSTSMPPPAVVITVDQQPAFAALAA